MNIKEIKQEIRKLTKIKRKCRAGSTERLDLHRKIKELESKIIEQSKEDPEKEKVIVEILKLEADITDFIDLRKFDVSQLELHLKKLKEKQK